MVTENDKLLREFKSVLKYDPDTGEFRWKRARQGARAGGLVGCKTSLGYIHAKILGRQYPLHRVAWFMTNHEWPNVIDHINGDKTDNRLCNLRNTTDRINAQNKQRHRNGRLVGACWSTRDKKWIASIRVNGKVQRLGYFATEMEAHEEYMKWASVVGQKIRTQGGLHSP